MDTSQGKPPGWLRDTPGSSLARAQVLTRPPLYEARNGRFSAGFLPRGAPLPIREPDLVADGNLS